MFHWIIFLGAAALGSNWQCVIIGLDNGLASNRRQAIIWTNDGIVYWHMYVSLGLTELTAEEREKLFHIDKMR